jgi:hypothetical protein
MDFNPINPLLNITKIDYYNSELLNIILNNTPNPYKIFLINIL